MAEILNKLIQADKKGAFLELITEDILRDLKFDNVRRQKGGSQYGYDVMGYRFEHEKQHCWKIECKNLKGSTTLEDIAPKLMWHISGEDIDRFVIVSPLGISNDLVHLLEQKLFYFPVEIWQGDYLEKLVFESPLAFKRIGLETCQIKKEAKPLIFLPNEIFFDAYHSYQQPYSYDYFLDGGDIAKTYTEQGFAINASVQNPTKEELIVNQINIKTLNFKNVAGRILRQYKLKGIVDRTEFEFTPEPHTGGRINVLQHTQALEVKPNSVEHLSFVLSRDSVPGYYNLIIELVGRFKRKDLVMYSHVIPLNIIDRGAESVNLCVVEKHYDSPVEKILSLSQANWELLKNTPTNCINFLGPTISGIAKGTRYNRWKIYQLRGALDPTNNTMDIPRDDTDNVLLDLDMQINENLYSLTRPSKM